MKWLYLSGFDIPIICIQPLLLDTICQ